MAKVRAYSTEDASRRIAEADALESLEEIRRELAVETNTFFKLARELSEAFIRGGPRVTTGPRRGRRMSLPWCRRRMSDLHYYEWQTERITELERFCYARARQFGAEFKTLDWLMGRPIVGDAA